MAPGNRQRACRRSIGFCSRQTNHDVAERRAGFWPDWLNRDLQLGHRFRNLQFPLFVRKTQRQSFALRQTIDFEVTRRINIDPVGIREILRHRSDSGLEMETSNPGFAASVDL